MRLCRLDLVRYGKFTGTSVDFGAAVGGQPDLHVVYGPNEAGKSTALNAWLDLLFGIEAQSGYAFLHPYSTMRVGAVIDTGGRALALSRIKGNRATLLGEGDLPLPEAVVLGPLGGLDRRALREMFSLDDETLEAGGNSILDSDGEVGQLLFASGAGLAGFAPALAGLRKAPDPFFRPPSRSGELADLKARLVAVEEERRRLDTDASGWKRLVQARDAAEAAWQTAQAARDAPVRALQGVQRHLAALPGARALDAARVRLAALPDLPPPPEGWAEMLAGMMRDAAAASSRLEALEAALAALRAERTALVPDPAVLAARAGIAAAATFRSAHDEAVKDLPARRAEASGLMTRIGVALDRLGRAGADPAAVLPDRAAVAALRALIEARSGVGQAVVLARREADLAVAEAERAAAEATGEAGGGDVAPLAHLFRRLQDEAPAAALARAEAALDAARAVLAQRMRALRPWAGSAEALAGMVLPGAAMIAGWKTRLAALAPERAVAAGEVRRLDAALAGAVLPEAGGGLSLDAAAQARARREAAWAAHRAALDATTATAFEAAMRQDDAVTAGLAETLTEARRRAEMVRVQAGLLQERALAGEKMAVLEAAGVALQAEMAAALATCGLPAMAPDALETWVALQGQAVEAADAVSVASQVALRAQGAVDAARGALVSALGLAGVPVADEGLALLLARAGAVCEAAQQRAAQLAALTKARAQVVARQAALAQAEAALQVWQAGWDEALAAARLPAGQGVDAARDDLGVLEGLATDHRALSGLAYRIREMEANVAGYGAAVQGVADRLGMAADGPARLGDALAERLAGAEATAQRIADVEAKLARAAQETGAQRAAQAGIAARVGEMVAGFGASDAGDLASRLAQAGERMRALDEVARAGEALRQVLEVADEAAARAALAGLDRDALVAEAARLGDEVTERGRAAQAAFAALNQAQRQLDGVGGDDAVLRLAETRETLLLEITEGARDHLARRLGLIAVEHGLRRYRDRHRSAMIEAASEAFRTMTRGAYTGLATQPEGAREVLVALAAGGGSKRAGDLSKGTRFQLYLALRVAAYHERAAQGPVPPFVADDIMETFDDDRAAEAFTVMAGMAAKGQVIYLTHHHHLCEIACAVCPQVRLHRLV